MLAPAVVSGGVIANRNLLNLLPGRVGERRDRALGKQQERGHRSGRRRSRETGRRRAAVDHRSDGSLEFTANGGSRRKDGKT